MRYSFTGLTRSAVLAYAAVFLLSDGASFMAGSTLPPPRAATPQPDDVVPAFANKEPNMDTLISLVARQHGLRCDERRRTCRAGDGEPKPFDMPMADFRWAYELNVFSLFRLAQLAVGRIRDGHLHCRAESARNCNATSMITSSPTPGWNGNLPMSWDTAAEVVVYVKLPKDFLIPTQVKVEWS